MNSFLKGETRKQRWEVVSPYTELERLKLIITASLAFPLSSLKALTQS